MVNLEIMKQLLDRGIEPTLLNEVLRRELAEAAPKAPQVAVQATLNLPPMQWTAEGEVKPHLAALKSAYAVTQQARRDAGSMAGGAHLRGVYAQAAKIQSIATMQQLVKDAMLKVGGRSKLAEALNLKIADVVAWLTGSRAPNITEAHALAAALTADADKVDSICERADLVIVAYRSALGMMPAYTHNTKKGE